VSKTFDYAKNPVRNDQRAPKRGVCKMMWDLFDSASAPISSKHLPKIAEDCGWNVSTLRAVRGEWEKFHGAAVPAKKAVKAAPAKKAAKAAPAKKAAKAAPAKKAAPAEKAGKLTYSIEKGIKFKPPVLSEAAYRPGGAAAA